MASRRFAAEAAVAGIAALQKSGMTVQRDIDRAKFAAADLIGIPWQILVGPKGLAEGKLEVKRRSDGTRENLSPPEVVARLT